MKISHKIILWIIATLLLSILIIYLLSDFKKYFPVESFIYAFELHFILMAWYAFSLPFLKLSYNNTYYQIKPFEKEGGVYVYFGVNVFRGFLKIIGWNKVSDKSNGHVKKDLIRLKKREKHTREAELAHVLLFIHFVLISIYFLPNYNVFWLLVLNVFLHAFPIFVQRYNRPRYLKLITKLETRKNLE